MEVIINRMVEVMDNIADLAGQMPKTDEERKRLAELQSELGELKRQLVNRRPAELIKVCPMCQRNFNKNIETRTDATH